MPTGYDDNYVFGNPSGKLQYIGALSEETSGRKVKVYSTKPGLQLYTGYWIGEMQIRGKKKFGPYSGIALETQFYPDAIHHKHFPSPLLKPGELYKQQTVFRFSNNSL